MVKKYNISKPEKYVSNGAEKTYWANCGTMTEFIKDDGSVSRIIEIPAISLKASIFPAEPRQATNSPIWPKDESKYQNGAVPPGDVPPVELDPIDISF